MHIFHTLWPSEQQKVRSLSQIPQTHPEEAMQKRSIKLGQVHKLSSHKLQSDTKPCHSWNTIFLVYGRDPNLPLHQILELMQQFLGYLESGLLNLEAHCLALAITKKTLDENCFRTAQKTTDREPPSFKIGDRVYIKNKQLGKWDLKWRPGYWIVLIEHNGHYLYIKNQLWEKQDHAMSEMSYSSHSKTMEHQHALWQRWKIHQPFCKFANYYSCRLKMKNSTHVHSHL